MKGVRLIYRSGRLRPYCREQEDYIGFGINVRAGIGLQQLLGRSLNCFCLLKIGAVLRKLSKNIRFNGKSTLFFHDQFLDACLLMNTAFCAQTMELFSPGAPNPLTESHQGDAEKFRGYTKREVHYAKGNCFGSWGSEVTARSEEVYQKG